MSGWLWLIPGGALCGALINALIGGRLKAQQIAWFASAAVAVSCAAVIAIWLTPADLPLRQTLYIWISVGQWQPAFGFTLDRISLLMVSVITGVGLLIHIYSIPFMAGEQAQRRFYFFMNLFLGGMLVLVLADNLLLLYLGWEMVGLCSYALIGFWYRIPANATAGRKAFIVTRVGDTSLAIGIFLLFSHFHTLSFDALFVAAAEQWTPGSGLALLTAALILGGALGKSAQLPLHVWIPDAMAGPTPVSALIHAATMVTAGVYLLIRMHPLLELAPQVQWLVAIIGAVTILYGASSALGQYDIKRVLAYSTISQVGYMFLAVGCGAYALALFHLVTHACFKALLFLSAGAVIRAHDGEHDIRRMGGMAAQLPVIRFSYLIGAASLAALPLLTAGFYSKDAILAAAWQAPAGPLLWCMAILGSLLTSAYIFRNYLLIFHGPCQKKPLLSDIPAVMAAPMLLLSLLSLTTGFVEMPEGWWGPHLLTPWLESDVGVASMPAASTAHGLLLISALMVTAGIALAFKLARRERAGRPLPLAELLLQGWGFDALYTTLFVHPYRRLAALTRRWIDEKIIENGVSCLTRGFVGLARFSRGYIEFTLIEGVIGTLVASLRRAHLACSATQNGMLSRYAAAITTGAVLILAYSLWKIGG